MWRSECYLCSSRTTQPWTLATDKQPRIITHHGHDESLSLSLSISRSSWIIGNYHNIRWISRLHLYPHWTIGFYTNTEDPVHPMKTEGHIDPELWLVLREVRSNYSVLSQRFTLDVALLAFYPLPVCIFIFVTVGVLNSKHDDNLHILWDIYWFLGQLLRWDVVRKSSLSVASDKCVLFGDCFLTLRGVRL